MTTNILFIEDDIIDQLAFKRFVQAEALPYTYTMVSSVRDAQAEIQQNEFDVILSDYNLRDGTAFELLSTAGERKVPFVFMTGMGAEEIAVQALKSGAQDYLVKELNHRHFDQIPQTIEKVIQQNRSAQIEYLTQVERSIAAIIMTDRNGLIIEANQTFADLAGFKAVEEICDHTVWCNRFQINMGDILKTVFEAGGYLTNHPFNFTNLKGEEVHTTGNFSWVTSETMSRGQLKVTLMDVTRLKAEEEARLEKEQEVNELQEMMRLRESLSSMIVHDLRNPLSIIGLSTQMIAEFTDDEMVLKMVDRILSRTAALENLIDDMLTTARMDSGSLALEPAITDFQALAREVLANSESIAEQYGISLQLNSASPPPPALIDQKLIRRLLDNLISNAIKFSPSGGNVSLDIRLDKSAPKTLEFSVCDEGSGIQPDEREKIFERFQTGSVKAKRGKQIGLGLPFCKLVVEAHGGTIQALDNSPKGARFTVRIPLEAAKG